MFVGQPMASRLARGPLGAAFGTRDWASLMSPDALAHFDERLKGLAADATGWVLDGRASLGPRAEPLHTPTR